MWNWRRRSACRLRHAFARVKALEQDGFISRYVTLLDPWVVGLRVNVFVQVRLERQIASILKSFEAAVGARPEIMECYLMTGTYDYLLRVVVSDLETCQRFLTEFVAKVPGVGNIQSSFALKQVKYKTALPIAEDTRTLGLILQAKKGGAERLTGA